MFIYIYFMFFFIIFNYVIKIINENLGKTLFQIILSENTYQSISDYIIQT